MWQFILTLTQIYIIANVFTEELSSECIDNSRKAEIEACCNFPRPIPEDELPACIKKYRNLMGEHTNYIVCLSDCQFVRLGVLKNNRVDLKGFRNSIKHLEPVARDAIDRVAQMCLGYLNGQKATIDKAATKCNAMSFAFLKCLGEKVFANCPDKYWSSRDICKKYDRGVSYCQSN